MAIYFVLLMAICAIVFIKLAQIFYKQFQFAAIVNKIPGPKGYPILGNTLEILKIGREGRYEWVRGLCLKYEGGIFRTWIGMQPHIDLTTAETVGLILPSKNLITKSEVYDFIYPWLGRGLITSTGNRWHRQRKLITPTFHFNILDDFAVVMSEKAEILKQCIELQRKNNPNDPIDVFELVTRCALDIICESAMGININAQTDHDAEYSLALHGITIQALQRIFRPWLHADWIYYRTARGKKFKRSVEIAHKFTNQVISERKLAREIEQQNPNEEIFTEADFNCAENTGVVCQDTLVFFELLRYASFPRSHRYVEYVHIIFHTFNYLDKPKRRAFLDHLLDACERDNMPLTDEEVRQEVDTFLFAGHDTTAAAMSWALFHIGNNPDVEEKIHQEQLRVFGDSTEPATLHQLSELKYLERVIKETLRLCPSAPTIGRRLTEDIDIAGYKIPKGATVDLHIFLVHQDPKYWPEPQKFDPDRFLLENSHGRHPYAYIPFSAGPRNCVGQRFSLLEQKTVLTAVLRTWRVKSLLKNDEAKYFSEFILRPQGGIEIYFTRK